MTHGSLFSGIGGIDLGFRWAGIETVWQVEKDAFCRRVLEKHWPTVQRFSDVRECGKDNLRPVDVISGGFPCQDISVAGRRAGLDGERSRLWWEYARIVGELRPEWVLVENVARLLDTDGDRVLAQMEAENYRCWTFVLGAKTIGATHHRSRAWIFCRRADAVRNEHPAETRHRNFPATAGRAFAEAVQAWNARADELAAASRLVGPDTYARIVRTSHGIPHWLDRLRGLGNAVVPQIPMLFGSHMAGSKEFALETLSQGRRNGPANAH